MRELLPLEFFASIAGSSLMSTTSLSVIFRDDW